MGTFIHFKSDQSHDVLISEYKKRTQKCQIFYSISSVQAGGTPKTPLLTSIFQKLLVILAVSLLHRCQHWRRNLPPQLKSAAPPGTLCVLFWPPAGMELHMADPPTPPAGGVAAEASSGDNVLEQHYGQRDFWWRRCAPAFVTKCSLHKYRNFHFFFPVMTPKLKGPCVPALRLVA